MSKKSRKRQGVSSNTKEKERRQRRHFQAYLRRLQKVLEALKTAQTELRIGGYPIGTFKSISVADTSGVYDPISSRYNYTSITIPDPPKYGYFNNL